MPKLQNLVLQHDSRHKDLIARVHHRRPPTVSPATHRRPLRLALLPHPVDDVRHQLLLLHPLLLPVRRLALLLLLRRLRRLHHLAKHVVLGGESGERLLAAFASSGTNLLLDADVELLVLLHVLGVASRYVPHVALAALEEDVAVRALEQGRGVHEIVHV